MDKESDEMHLYGMKPSIRTASLRDYGWALRSHDSQRLRIRQFDEDSGLNGTVFGMK